MPKTVQSISAQETLDILSKGWLDTKDISKVASVGRDRGRKIRKEIETLLINDGYKLTTKIPTDYVVKYLNININYLKKMTK